MKAKILSILLLSTFSPLGQAMACPFCNRHKGPNIVGIDPLTDQSVMLFNPRRHLWSEHFQVQDAMIVGITDIGRTTVKTLAMNAEKLLTVRRALLREKASSGESA